MEKLMAFLLLATLAPLIYSQSSVSKSETIRLAVEKIGTGEKAKVELALKDGSKVKGYISSSSSEAVTIAGKDVSGTRVINYSDIERIKKRGGLGRGAIAAIVAAGGGAAVLIGLIAIRCKNEPGAC